MVKKKKKKVTPKIFSSCRASIIITFFYNENPIITCLYDNYYFNSLQYNTSSKKYYVNISQLSIHSFLLEIIPKFKGEWFEVCVLYGGVLNHTLRIRNIYTTLDMFSLFSKQIEVCRIVYCDFFLPINTEYKIVSLFA